MKIKRIAFIILVLVMTLLIMSGCGRGIEKEEPEEQTVIQTVTRGDLSLDISAIGNLALSQKETLAFELTGTVNEILVEVGDYVEEGQVLATLDMSERDDQLKTLSRAIETKDQALLQAEINYQNAADALETIYSQAYADQKQAQAELEVANAEISMASAQEIFDIAEDLYLQNWTVPERIRNYNQKKAQLDIAKIDLIHAEKRLEDVSADLEIERETKQKELVIKESQLEDAQQQLDEAIEALEEAQNQEWNVTAPYEGFITSVNLIVGSAIQKGAAAIEIADPDEFEAEVYVSEMDIFNIAVGVPATASVDAAQTMILPAEVVKISPTATIQQGVVNYAVKIKINSIDDMIVEAGETMRKALEDLESGELPPRLKQAVEAGKMTQEEAEEMAEKMKSSEFPQMPEGKEKELVPGDKEFSFGKGAFTSGGDTDNSTIKFPAGGLDMGITSSGGFQLREGLTVTVSIVIEEVTDVLLVPSAAITMKGGTNYVKVVLPDGTTEDRAIETGVSDWQNTEVISGLSEGEEVEVTLTSSTSSFESQGFFMPGIRK
ncbi:MAG: HlyD family efflux transporter periplasmic adaptor subunit [Dehalococcoidales bacterium]|nr:MAG: HlyD family efflux transporter periplasmic adaptor subunit [Dehalococcoidales bacterium]